MNTRQALEALHEDIVVEAMSSNIWQEKKHARVTMQAIINELQDVLDSRRKLDTIKDKIAALKQQLEP